MLSEFLWIFFCAAAFCGGMLTYRQGIKDGRRLAEKEPLPPLCRPTSPGKQAVTAAALRTQQLLENMERYDGSENGQREVAP